MKLIASVQLETNEGMFAALQDTLHEANRCSNWLSEQAWDEQIFGQFKLHKRAYAKARERFPKLTAQVIVRSIAQVSASYKTAFSNYKQRTVAIKAQNERLAKQGKPLKKLPEMKLVKFRLDGAIAYDLRILRWYVEKQAVSIWTTSGRLQIPFVCGARQKELLSCQQGESDLILRDGRFYLAATCQIDEPTPGDIDGVLGCDLGVNNILTDSMGHRYSGSHVKSVRHRHRRLRTKLQKKGTKSAKRRLKKLSGQESRFARNVNHCISKEIVAKAQGTKHAIALEDLTHIRLRITARKSQRSSLHSWAFAQLGAFLAYKARRSGVRVIYVDPRNTSRACFACGHTEKANRPEPSIFRCRSCGHTDCADTNAAKNIGRAALVNQPNVAGCESLSHDSVASSPALAGE